MDQNGMIQIVYVVAYATVQLSLKTFPTHGRSLFYLILSRHLFDREITFKAPGSYRGRGRCRIALAGV